MKWFLAKNKIRGTTKKTPPTAGADICPIRRPRNSLTTPKFKGTSQSLHNTTFSSLRGGRIRRDSKSRLAPPRRNASPPPYTPHNQHPPDLNITRPAAPPSYFNPPATLLSSEPTKEVASLSASAAVPPSPTSTHAPPSSDAGHTATSALHPRVAVILGVDRKWYIPLLVCRALSTLPSAWWGLRCAFTFLAELLHIRPGMGREGWAAAIIGSVGQEWDVERRFRVTEVALAIMWVCCMVFPIGEHVFCSALCLILIPLQCSASAYLSYFFTDCLMSRWLVLDSDDLVLLSVLTILGS